MYELQMIMNCLQLLLLAAVTTITFGVPIKRQSDSTCLFQYVTQPLNTNLNSCNPFSPAENSLTLECSILVGDSREGELTIDWIYSDSRDLPEILSSATTVTSPGATITSNFTVPTTKAGKYYCRPNSTQAGLLQSSSQTIILSRAQYFHTDTSCKGLNLSTEQSQCILSGSLTEEPGETATLPSEATTLLPVPEATSETTTNMNIPQKPQNGNAPILAGITVAIMTGTIVFTIVIVVCAVQCFHCRRTNRSKVPHSQGNGTRIVTEWHAIRRTTLRNQESARYGLVTPNQRTPTSSTDPPVRAISTRESKLTSSGYVDANALIHGLSYQEGTSTTSLQHDWQADETHRALQSSYTSAEHLYANFQPPHTKLRVEPTQEERANEATNTQSGTDTLCNHLPEETYSVVGRNTPIYQGLVPETMDYLSLYHTVNKN